MEPEKQQQIGAMWGLGDYTQIAERLSPAAAAVVTTVSKRAGAAAGWSVDAIDISPALAEQGRESTAQQGLDVRWHEAPLDTLPFDDSSADLVGSSFGLIFAQDPDQALGEIGRVLRPGGALAFSAWTPSSYIAVMTDLMTTFMPEGPPSTTFRWGDPATCGPWVGKHFDTVEITTHTLPWHFESSRAASDFMFTRSPGHVASLIYAGDRAQEMRTAVEQQLDELASDGSIRIEAEYVVVSALCR